MLRASCSLELFEMVPTEHTNTEDTEEGITSSSSKDTSSSGVLMESMGKESRPHSKSLTAWSKMDSLHTLVQVESGLVLMPYLWNQDKCVIVQKSNLLNRCSLRSYPVTAPESQGLMPTTKWKLTIPSSGTQPGKEDPFPLCWEGGRIRWLCWPSKSYAPPYKWNGWGKAEWVAKSFPLLKAVND